MCLSKNENHAEDDGKVKACWDRASTNTCRKNAMKGIKAKFARKDVYDNELALKMTLISVKPDPEVRSDGSKVQVAPGSPIHTARYKLDKFDGSEGHYPSKSPYPHEIHHMIPVRAFYNKFDSDAQQILDKIDYDANNENNLIFLPASLSETKYHVLPWHQRDDFHRPYSDEVRRAATKIESKLNDILSKQKACEVKDVPDSLVKELIEYENLLWNVIVNLGPVSINEASVPDGVNLRALM